MWSRQALRGRTALFAPVHFLSLRRVPDGQYPVPQDQVRPAQGLLHRVFRIDQQKGGHLHGTCPQALPQAEDLLGVQAQGHQSDEEFGRPSPYRYGRSGRNSVRRTGRRRQGQVGREQKAGGGRHREKEKGSIQTICPGDIQGGRRILGRLYERPYRDHGQGDHGPMDRLRSSGEDLREPSADTLRKKRT